jgi:hypothetical protein
MTNNTSNSLTSNLRKFSQVNKKQKHNFLHLISFYFLQLYSLIKYAIYTLTGYPIFLNKLVLSVDSSKRDKTLYNLVENFRLKVKNIRNCISITVLSLEIPNTSYTFQKTRKNNFFKLRFNYCKEAIIELEDGNYDSCNIIKEINNQLEFINKEYDCEFELHFDKITAKTTITNNNVFELIFDSNTNYKSFGYYLGFRDHKYCMCKSYTSESLLNTIGDNLIYVKINNYGNTISDRYKKYMSKVILNQNKYSICFNSSNSSTNDKYIFDHPTNIEFLDISLHDINGHLVMMNDIDYSIALCIEYI